MTSAREERSMSHDPHPFHIVGECEECCMESEALRLGFPDPAPLLLGCETPGCVNGWQDDVPAPQKDRKPE